MDYLSISVVFISTILGAAYPILLQVVTNLGDKYQSGNILVVFKQEKTLVIFQYLLYINISLLVIWVIFARCCIQFDTFVYSLLYLLLFTTLFLVLIFLQLIRSILQYFSPLEFLALLIRKHNASVKPDNIFFASIADITINSIKKENLQIQQKLTDFLNEESHKFLKYTEEDQISEFQKIHLRLIHRCSQSYHQNYTLTNSYLKDQMVSYGWIFDNFIDQPVSEVARTYIWDSISGYCLTKKDDFIMAYWKKAHSYYTSGIPAIHIDYDFETTQPKNQKEHEQRKKIRENFLHFNYMVVALVLHTENYDALKRIFNYTQTLPESYEMLPDTIGDIYKTYLAFKDPFDERYVFIESSYSFPKLDGLKSHHQVKYAVRLYLALLFVRLYFLHLSQNFRSPLDLPVPNHDLAEKRKWLNEIDTFYFAVEKILQNNELLKALNFTPINDDEWLKSQSKETPLYLLNKFKVELEESIRKHELNQTVLPDELQKFQTNSSILINEAISKIKSATSDIGINPEETKSWYVNGIKQLLDKAPFAESSESNHLNYNTITGSQIKRKILSGFMETFYLNVSRSFVINSEELVEALNNLSLDDSHVILSTFGDTYFLEKAIGHPEWNTDQFNQTPVIQFSDFNRPLLSQSLFILKNEDLPAISFNEPNKEEKEKFNLVLYDPNIKLYGNVLDLGKAPAIQSEVMQDYPNKSIENSVLAILSIQMQITWKKNTEVLLLRIQTSYTNRGIPDNPKTVQFT